MFQFEHPYYLWLLALIPMYPLLQWFVGKMRGSNLADGLLLEKMVNPEARWSQMGRTTAIVLGLFFLVLALANPQWGTKREKVQSKGSDIILALDISQSMMCEDLAPNRLERAKRFTERLLDRLKGERVGVVLFAGSAYLQMPMTTDYAAAKLFIKSAHPRLAASQGTAIGDAIDLAKKVFGTEDEYHKALIIMTDGETHDEGALEEAETAGQQDMILFLVGVGTTEGGYVPIEYQGRLDYMRDEKGDFVKSVLNEEIMRNLAAAGNGAYYNVVGGSEILDELDRRIDQLEKKELEQRSFEEFESYYTYMLLTALICFGIGFFFFYPSPKNRLP